MQGQWQLLILLASEDKKKSEHMTYRKEALQFSFLVLPQMNLFQTFSTKHVSHGKQASAVYL